jgi:Na+-transporting NADH:ubiquinone oxidoreductase subunit NqrB
LALLPGTWVSPGQWGNDLALAVWLLMLGSIVTGRARRIDISWVFLCAFLGLVALRVSFLGQPWAIWRHQFGNGALLLFAFFMVSDPMTIPNHRATRIVYALIVAVVAFAWQYALFRPNAFIWALFFATPLVPILDWIFPGDQFAWRGGAAASTDPVAPNLLPASSTCGTRSRAVAATAVAQARNATVASSTYPGRR